MTGPLGAKADQPAKVDDTQVDLGDDPVNLRLRHRLLLTPHRMRAQRQAVEQEACAWREQ